MASNIKITTSDISKGRSTYDYSTDVKMLVTEYDSRKTRFLLAIEDLLNRYFSDEKNQNSEYNERLAEFLLNNHRKFLEDLLDDEGILDKFSEIVEEIANSSNSSAGVFIGLTDIDKTRIITELKQICINGTKRIGKSSEMPYAKAAKTVLDSIDQKFESAYSGKFSKTRPSKNALKERYIALSEKFITNSKSGGSNTLYSKYNATRSKTKCIIANLLSISVMESTKKESVGRINKFMSHKLSKLDEMSKNVEKSKFWQSSLNIGKLLLYPLKLFSKAFWKNLTNTVFDWYKGYFKIGFKSVFNSLLFPLEKKILNGLKNLKESPIFKFIHSIASTISGLTVKLVSKLKMTVSKLVRYIFRLLRLPWIFLIIGALFGKVIQNIVNEHLSEDSIFKTKGFQELPFTGNESTFQELARNKYLRPISKELLFVDSVLHGINDFVMFLDNGNSSTNPFSNALKFNKQDNSEGDSGDRARDNTFSMLKAINQFFHTVFIGDEGKDSVLKRLIHGLLNTVVVPIRQSIENINAKYNGMTFDKMIDLSQDKIEESVELLSKFLDKILMNISLRSGLALGKGLMGLVPGGNLVKMLGTLAIGGSFAAFASGIIGKTLERDQHLFDKEYGTTDKLTATLQRDESLYSEFSSAKSQLENVVERSLKQGNPLEITESDTNFMKALKGKTRNLSSRVKQSIDDKTVSIYSESETPKAKENLKAVLETLKTQSDQEIQAMNNLNKAVDNAVMHQIDSTDPYGQSVRLKSGWKNAVMDVITSSLAKQTKLGNTLKRDGDNFTLEKPSNDVTSIEGVSDNIQFRSARLNLVNYLIKRYEAGLLSTNDFISEFNKTNDPNNRFYVDNKIDFSNKPSVSDEDVDYSSLAYGSNVLRNSVFKPIDAVSAKQASFWDEFLHRENGYDTSAIDDLDIQRSAFEYRNNFDKSYNLLAEHIYSETMKEIDSLPDGDEKNKFRQKIRSLFENSHFRDALYNSAKGTSYEVLFAALAHETEGRSLKHNLTLMINNNHPMFESFVNYAQAMLMKNAFDSMSMFSNMSYEVTELTKSLQQQTSTGNLRNHFEKAFEQLGNEYKRIKIETDERHRKDQKTKEQLDRATEGILNEKQLTENTMSTVSDVLEEITKAVSENGNAIVAANVSSEESQNTDAAKGIQAGAVF